jgi:hypothetical protein
MGHGGGRGEMGHGGGRGKMGRGGGRGEMGRGGGRSQLRDRGEEVERSEAAKKETDGLAKGLVWEGDTRGFRG